MKRFAELFIFFLISWAAVPVAGVRASTELPLQSHYEQSTDPLTTEKVWALEPDEQNPHRLRWVLSRHVEIAGLKPVAVKSGRTELYRVQADSLYGIAKSYIRGVEDPAYSELKDFPCTSAPQEWFSTLQGTRFAADRAGELWNELLSDEVFKLSVRLRHVEGEFPENAVRDSNEALGVWLSGLDRAWKEDILPKVREEEWKYYDKQAREAGFCKEGAFHKAPRSWVSMMEIPITMTNPQLVARAPAKRWGGLFSVLVTMNIGGQELVGKFLIDSGAPKSIISPTFLQNQGAFSSWIEIPKAKPARISWSGGSGVGTPAYVAEVKISGVVVPIHQFYIHETDFFGPPESFSTCCDGILGMDFLSQYAVEFRPGKTSAINLYARAGFHPPHPIPWVEESINAHEEIVSQCDAMAKSAGHERINDSLKWDTGSEMALEFNRSNPNAKKPGLRWLLNCGTTRLGENLQIASREQGGTATTSLDAGMELMARDQFFMDLGHGRIWFNPQGLALPIVQNHSGLNLEFNYFDGERELKVIGIRKASPSEVLRKAGLKVGDTVMSLDSKSVDEMDTWEVEQRLAGVYGDSVAVEWKTGKKSSKIAPMKLPIMSP